MNLKDFQALSSTEALALTFGARVYGSGDLGNVSILSVEEAKKVTPLLVPAIPSGAKK